MGDGGAKREGREDEEDAASASSLFLARSSWHHTARGTALGTALFVVVVVAASGCLRRGCLVLVVVCRHLSDRSSDSSLRPTRVNECDKSS